MVSFLKLFKTHGGRGETIKKPQKRTYKFYTDLTP